MCLEIEKGFAQRKLSAANTLQPQLAAISTDTAICCQPSLFGAFGAADLHNVFNDPDPLCWSEGGRVKVMCTGAAERDLLQLLAPGHGVSWRAVGITLVDFDTSPHRDGVSVYMVVFYDLCIGLEKFLTW